MTLNFTEWLGFKRTNDLFVPGEHRLWGGCQAGDPFLLFGRWHKSLDHSVPSWPLTHPWPHPATPVVTELSPLPLSQPTLGDSHSAGPPRVHCHIESAQGWSFHNSKYGADRRPDMSREHPSDKFWWPIPPQYDLWPLLYSMHVPNLRKDLQTSIKSSPNTPLFAQAGVHRQRHTHKTNRDVCTQNKLRHAPVDTRTRNTSRSCRFGWRGFEVGGLWSIICHAYVNLSRALWTLLTSQCCWALPVFVIVDM